MPPPEITFSLILVLIGFSGLFFNDTRTGKLLCLGLALALVPWANLLLQNLFAGWGCTGNMDSGVTCPAGTPWTYWIALPAFYLVLALNVAIFTLWPLAIVASTLWAIASRLRRGRKAK